MDKFDSNLKKDIFARFCCRYIIQLVLLKIAIKQWVVASDSTTVLALNSFAAK
jgi:hypothetical protein